MRRRPCRPVGAGGYPDRNQPAAVYTVPAWRSARTYGETTTWAEVLVEKGRGRILGAHLVGHGAEETIHTFALAIEEGIDSSRAAPKGSTRCTKGQLEGPARVEEASSHGEEPRHE